MVQLISPHYRFSSHFSFGEFVSTWQSVMWRISICQVEKFLHMTYYFSTGTARGARDKYEVCSSFASYSRRLTISQWTRRLTISQWTRSKERCCLCSWSKVFRTYGGKEGIISIELLTCALALWPPGRVEVSSAAHGGPCKWYVFIILNPTHGWH